VTTWSRSRLQADKPSRAQLSNGAAGWQETKSGQDRKQKARAKAASWHHVTDGEWTPGAENSRGPFGSMQTDGDESQA
jgi:hypothetical protein